MSLLVLNLGEHATAGQHNKVMSKAGMVLSQNRRHKIKVNHLGKILSLSSLVTDRLLSCLAFVWHLPPVL